MTKSVAFLLVFVFSLTNANAGSAAVVGPHHHWQLHTVNQWREKKSGLWTMLVTGMVPMSIFLRKAMYMVTGLSPSHGIQMGMGG
jgi:hypothetical protein